MTSDDKITYLEKQIAAVLRSETNIITCPYCMSQNKHGNEHVCCITFGRAIAAIFHRQDVAEDIREYERIAENLQRDSVPLLVVN